MDGGTKPRSTTTHSSPTDPSSLCTPMVPVSVRSQTVHGRMRCRNSSRCGASSPMQKERLPQSTDCPLLVCRWFFGCAHGPVQPFAKAAAHDPSFIVLAKPGEFLGKKSDHLPISVTDPRNIGSPENSLRPEGVEHLAQIAVQDGERIRLAGIVRDRARLHSDVRALGQGEQPGQMGEGLVVELGPNETQMVDDKAQIRMARGNGVDQLQ